MTLHIRSAEPNEYDRVGEVIISAYRALPVDHLWGGYEDAIRATAERAKHADVLVAVEGNDVLGSVTYVTDHESLWSEWTQPGEAEFRLLAVDPVARGRGVGEHLVRACIARAQTTRQPLILHTTRWMETATRMYLRLGFARRPDRDVPYEVWNDPPVPDLPPEWVAQAFLAYIR